MVKIPFGGRKEAPQPFRGGIQPQIVEDSDPLRSTVDYYAKGKLPLEEVAEKLKPQFPDLAVREDVLAKVKALREARTDRPRA